jgi:hypothetical protein
LVEEFYFSAVFKCFDHSSSGIFASILFGDNATIIPQLTALEAKSWEVGLSECGFLPNSHIPRIALLRRNPVRAVEMPAVDNYL